MTGKQERFTKVRVALSAVAALPTAYRRVNRHANAIFGDAGDLVAQNERVRHAYIANASFGKPVQVRAADANRGDVDY
jgi:hypothetical protein